MKKNKKVRQKIIKKITDKRIKQLKNWGIIIGLILGVLGFLGCLGFDQQERKYFARGVLIGWIIEVMIVAIFWIIILMTVMKQI